MEIFWLFSGIAGLFYFLTRNRAGKSEQDGTAGQVKIIPISSKAGEGNYLNELYKKHGREKNVDWMLLKAIARVESSENPNAVNLADPSYGLMQILYRFDSSGQVNKLNVNGWPPKYTADLFDPDYNLHIGSQILQWNIRTYGSPRGIAVYNAWEARKSDLNGPFPNQGYVDKVLSELNKIKADNGLSYAA